MIAARPLYPIPGWQARLLDVAQAALDWFAAELAKPAPLLPRPELAVPDPEAALVGLRRHGRWLVPAPDGRGRWLAPWLVTGVELGWNALPPGVPPRVDRGCSAVRRFLCRLTEWIPRPAELARDRHCRLMLEGAALMLLLAWLLPPVALVGVGLVALLVVLVAPRLLAVRLPSRAVLAIRWRWYWRPPPRFVTGPRLELLTQVREAQEHGRRVREHVAVLAELRTARGRGRRRAA